jgi:indoleamine 2,3-dioxygenase
MGGMTTERLAAFQVDPVRGFVPAQDPVEQLPAVFEAWERLGRELPALLRSGTLRPALEGLGVPDLGRLEDEGQLRRAMLLLSFLGNAYVWGGPGPACRLPRGLALPWCRVAEQLGRPPIGSHASIALSNWRRLDKGGPLDPGNLAPLLVFLGGRDEEWFYVVTIALEAQGGPAMRAIVDAQEGVATGNVEAVAADLQAITAALGAMLDTLLRMHERCDPYVFFHRVRPFLTGWPEPGVVYEGVSGSPQRFCGGSAAQSSLLQSLDAGLGVAHRADEMHPFLMEMRRYMPPPHRRFIEVLEGGPSLRQFILDHLRSHPGLAERYNECITALEAFRRHHSRIAVRYIAEQAIGEEAGTGGSSFVRFLSKAREETQEHLIGQDQPRA